MKKRNLITVAGLVLMSLVSAKAHADARDQAKRLHDRLTGVPPSEAILDQMEQLVLQGNAKGAAQLATDVTRNPAGGKAFYNLSLVRWSSVMTNTGLSPRVPLDDFQATVVGLVRDNRSFKDALFADVVYTGANPTVAATGVRAYARGDNNHFLDLDGKDLHALLTPQVQSTLSGLTDTAGLLTTRSFGAAFLSAGTNRRSTRFALKDFLCMDFENVADATRPDDRVRRDVSRAPGGSRDTYITTCKGCHAGMDGLSGAWAYVDFTNNQVSAQATPVGKMNQNNSVYSNGATVRDNSWVNYWTVGNNATLIRWRGNGYQNGIGIRSFGQALSETGAFSDCMAKRAFEYVCARNSVDADKATLGALSQGFEAKNYNLRELFEDASIRCMGN